MEDNVTITRKEYESLLNDLEFLECLRIAGVDNWEGYEIAQDMMIEENE